MNGVWIIGLAILALACLLGGLWQRAERRLRQAESQNEQLETRAAELDARLARETRARSKQAEALAEQRKRADKARKRKNRSVPERPLGTAARITDLEQRIASAERERDGARDERDTLVERVGDLERRLADATRVARASPPKDTTQTDANAAGVHDAPATSGVEESGGAPDRQAELEAALAEERERATKLDEGLRLAKQTEARMRKRMDNQEQLYASLRAELEVKKDRLRAQEEKIQRLEALEVVLGDA